MGEGGDRVCIVYTGHCIGFHAAWLWLFRMFCIVMRFVGGSGLLRGSS